jgi:hypothetical protein
MTTMCQRVLEGHVTCEKSLRFRPALLENAMIPWIREVVLSMGERVPHRRFKQAQQEGNVDGDKFCAMYSHILRTFEEQEVLAAAEEQSGSAAAEFKCTPFEDSGTVYVVDSVLKRGLYELLKEELTAVPETVKIKDSDWPRDSEGKFRVPSLQWFNKVLKKNFPAVRFTKKPSFTKCNACVHMRDVINSTRLRGLKQDVQYARSLHIRLVACEVRQIETVTQ